VGRRCRPRALALLGAARGPADESTFRRAFSLVNADVFDRVLDAWLHTRAVQAGGRMVIAIDGKTVRGAKDKGGKAPHLVAARAHGIGAVLGQVAVDEKSNEIPLVRDLLKAFASLACAVITIDAMRAGPGLDRSSTAPPRPPSCGARSRRRAGSLSRWCTSSPVTVRPARPPWLPGSAATGR
jgi:hypothetical protein